MKMLPARQTVPLERAARLEIADLVDAIGRDDFGARLVAFLHQVSGADYCAAFRLGHGSLGEVTASSFDPQRPAREQITRYVQQEWWRKDPAILEAQRRVQQSSSSLIRIDLGDARYSDLRPSIFPDVRDRLLICGRREQSAFGLSILRSSPHSEFAAGALTHLSEIADVLVSVVAKHADAGLHRANVAMALTSLDEIESCIVEMSDLPRREVEVSARILYGMSSAGISLDLGVAEESVKTYRKRAYVRLKVGSERELMTWYLSLWSAWRGCYYTVSDQSKQRYDHH
ncbi:MAG: helix-turn-helix transcriptional regulator [Burkholderiales bacterium]